MRINTHPGEVLREDFMIPLGLIRMLCCPVRSRLRGSNWFPGGARRSDSTAAAFR
jgi:hypothetical protein